MSGSNKKPDTIWFTRCAGQGRGGVPTATGIASQLGWLTEEFASDNIKVRALQDEDAQELRYHHYDHELPTLIREGGNLFSIPARAQGAKTRLIGLTWIEEGQFILVRPDSDIKTPADLKGKRLSLPAYNPVDIQQNKRGRSISRHMSLHGYKGALASAGLTLDDITLVEFGGQGTGGNDERSGFFVGADALLKGDIDGLYVKGGAAVDKARELGLVVGIDLDKLPERRFRVNNGTPRPITVHEDLLNNHFDELVRFLAQVLRAAEWAKTNLDGVYDALHKETGASIKGLKGAYRDGFHLHLAPDLSEERIELFRQQKDFLLKHGVLDNDFDFDGWIDHRPLAAAWKLLQSEKVKEEEAVAV